MPLPAPADHARRFAQVRLAHRTEMQEDYVELIADLIDELGEARVVDLAERLGVTAATVNNTISRLKRDELVESRPYRSVFLTDQGKRMAQAARARHELVVAFLIKLGVTPDTAELDAEGLEHHLSDETLDRMRTFAPERYRTQPVTGDCDR